MLAFTLPVFENVESLFDPQPSTESQLDVQDINLRIYLLGLRNTLSSIRRSTRYEMPL